MNDLLRNMIKTRDVVVFIDDVIVEIEREERHDEIVKEVLRRMVENGLFVKLEKCVWKVREIGFLEVIIGLEGMRIEKEKIQGGVDWLVPRSVKNM